MSGHSHFKTVKATKDANDAKKGKIFSKLGRLITITVKEKGADTLINSTLKTLMEKAKEFNMPKENVERAIKKGTGELAGENLEEFSLEGFGPGGIALIIEGITDNKNRSLGEVKTILHQHHGKMAGEGAVTWMFERKGLISINPIGKEKDALEMELIEAGADDLTWGQGVVEVSTKPEDLEKVKKALEEKGCKIESSSLGWVAKEEIGLPEKEYQSSQELFEELDENDAVQDIYSNCSLDPQGIP